MNQLVSELLIFIDGTMQIINTLDNIRNINKFNEYEKSKKMINNIVEVLNSFETELSHIIKNDEVLNKLFEKQISEKFNLLIDNLFGDKVGLDEDIVDCKNIIIELLNYEKYMLYKYLYDIKNYNKIEDVIRYNTSLLLECDNSESKKNAIIEIFNKLYSEPCKPENYLNQTYHTHHHRPQYTESINIWNDKLKETHKTAVVIQGPIINEDDFTIETIKLYKKNFKDSIIILSTWEDEMISDKKYLLDEKVELILNKKPDYAGITNMNYQIISSMNGIKRAKELGAEYVIKTRTDQRMYGRNIMEFFINFVKTYPIKGEVSQMERIIGVSMNTFKYRPYSLSDMTMFGYIEDMLKYWSPNLVTEEYYKDYNNYDPYNLSGWLKVNIAEMYFMTKYLESIGKKVEYNLEGSWKAFEENFGVIDKESLNLFWNKYAKTEEHRNVHYDYVRTDEIMDFKEWFNIYSGINNKVLLNEEILKDHRIGDILKEEEC